MAASSTLPTTSSIIQSSVDFDIFTTDRRASLPHQEAETIEKFVRQGFPTFALLGASSSYTSPCNPYDWEHAFPRFKVKVREREMHAYVRLYQTTGGCKDIFQNIYLLPRSIRSVCCKKNKRWPLPKSLGERCCKRGHGKLHSNPCPLYTSLKNNT